MAIVSTASLPSLNPGSNAPGALTVHRWRALGTDCLLQFPASSGEKGRSFISAAMTWVENFEARYSRFRETSLLSRINAAAGKSWVTIDAEMERKLDLCASIHFMTQGVLDVTALPIQRLWDYKAETPRVPSDAEIQAARRLVGFQKIKRETGKIFLPEPGMCLDFGGWGKEYAVDVVAQIARDHGIQRVLVDFGHDIRALGTPPERPAWHIGLEDPTAPGTHKGSVAVIDRGVASSGDYQRGFTLNGKRYGHIVDPRSGMPVSNECRQVTVIAPSCLQAGILSTAAFVLGPANGIRLIQETMGAEGLILTDKARHQTRGFFNYVVQS